MAACNIKIELEEPRKVYVDGEKVSGHVLVSVEKPTNCKGLEVTTSWSTHGRGNVDRGDIGTQLLFQGNWQPGEHRYPFALETATWPPTYYGRIINVSHYVQARAKLAWASDPKATSEITVWSSRSPADLAPVKKQTSWGVLGWIIGLLLLAILAFAFLFLIPIVLIVAGVVWFFTSYIPKSRTGPVLCTVQPARLAAGQSCACTLEFAPRRKTKINSVTASLISEESCVSGSGSNRKTHNEELQRKVERFLESTELMAGQKQAFQGTFQLPTGLPVSMKLSDNEVKWYVEFRIDIPSWPDFVKKLPVIVEPGAHDPQPAAAHIPDEPTWLDQVIEQLQQSAGDQQRLGLVLSAIAADDFEIALEIDETIDRPIEATTLPGGSWLATFDELHDLNCWLHVPEGIPLPQVGTTWRGRIQIVDYDPEAEQLVAAVAPTRAA